MISAIIFQLIMVAFAVCSAYEEAAFTFPFREYAFDWNLKQRYLKQAHRSGGIGCGVLFLGSGIITGVNYPGALVSQIFAGLFVSTLSLLWYWLLFDIVYSVRIGQKWHYIGTTAGTDIKLRQKFGANAGQIKAVGCVVLIIAINLAYKILL